MLSIEIVVWVLLVVSIISIIARKTKMPYTLGLIFGGLAISMFKLSQITGLEITTQTIREIAPELFMTVFLPGLLFESALNIDTEKLFKNIKTIGLFAVVGLIFTIMVSGAALHYLLNIPWQISLLFASIISSTDPVAVMSIFKKLGVPKNLGTIIEGESLFNDGTGIVIFNLLLTLAVSGSFSLGDGVLEFFRLVIGGIFVGLLIGYVSSVILKKVDDLTQITLTTVFGYGSYLIGEHLHLSGVITTVTVGLVISVLAVRKLTPQSKLELSSFWSYASFILNSMVFLLIGLEIDVMDLSSNIYPILFGFLSALIGRAITVYGLSYFINRTNEGSINGKIPLRWQHVIFWGGLHGGLSMVLVLSIPNNGSYLMSTWRPFLVNAVFGSVFFSLILQGTTMAKLLSILGLTEKNEVPAQYDDLTANLYMLTSGKKELKRLKESKIIPKKVYNKIKAKQAEEIDIIEKAISELVDEHPGLKEQHNIEIEHSLLISKKTALIEGYNKGLFSKKAYETNLLKINEMLLEFE